MMAALLIVLVLSLAFQIGYAVFLSHHTQRNVVFESPDPQGVSIIICAKNEAENLRSNLPRVLAQKYESAEGPLPWEVIVVDDGSTDETSTILRSFPDVRLRIISISKTAERTLPGKKYAMAQGVAAAQYPWILCTDADCAPTGTDWLRGMTAPLESNDVSIGYGLLKGKPSLLSAFIQAETLHAFIQSAAFANAGIPSSAVGRNMAFRKAFYQEQRHAAFDRLPSGDDDLLMHGPRPPRVAVVRGPGWMTASQHPDSLGAYLRQKRRHLSTGKYYRPAVKALLGGHALTHAAFWLSEILLICFAPGRLVLAVLTGALLRWFCFFAAWRLNQKILEIRPRPSWLLFDIGWLLYNIVLSPYILWKNKQAWK